MSSIATGGVVEVLGPLLGEAIVGVPAIGADDRPCGAGPVLHRYEEKIALRGSFKILSHIMG